MNLIELVRRVAEEREIAAKARATLAALRAEFEERESLAFERVRLSNELLADAEAAVREATLRAYAETGSKSPCPGVSVRLTSRPVYDHEVAFRWAKEHDMALQLDVKAFETIAKNGMCGSIVTFDVQPQAMIATDLSKALGAAEGQGE